MLDLGSGGGFDAFLAAKAVGEKGFVIGVDMTPEMVDHARQNARKMVIKTVDFRLNVESEQFAGDFSCGWDRESAVTTAKFNRVNNIGVQAKRSQYFIG